MRKMENTTLPFIVTCDADIKEKLCEAGMQVVNFGEGHWTFLNCPEIINRLNFANNTKIAFSNKLYV